MQRTNNLEFDVLTVHMHILFTMFKFIYGTRDNIRRLTRPYTIQLTVLHELKIYSDDKRIVYPKLG